MSIVSNRALLAILPSASPHNPLNGLLGLTDAVAEAFVVCRNLRFPPSFVPSLDKPLLGLSGNPDDHEAEMKFIAPFVACGDLERWADADANHPAPTEEEKRDVVQSPTNPAYKEYLEKKRLIFVWLTQSTQG